ncbi:hypothetical protein [Kocuria sp. TGY1127_2]|uniref:hypothetical protein n=1 Tax=Kocuria sp. TGY1127_2 TaxID=2711328 RepID=UPI0015BA703C|nr:hypothetical protein [Kocuria sp. TGY1127_2]
MTTLKDWTQAHRMWVDDFVLTLRLSGATGEDIADRLASVHTQCDEMDRSPEEEFGDPAEYAKSLGFEPKASEKRDVLRTALPVVVQVLLLLVGSYAIRDWITGTELVINLGTLICWVVLVAIVGVVTATTAWGSTAIYNVWVFTVVFGLAIVLGAAGALISRADLPVVFSGTPVFLAAVGILGVLAIAVLSTLRLVRTSRRTSDPRVRRDEPEQRRAGGAPRSLAVIVPIFWIIPLFMAFDAGFTAMTS